jgi:ATP-binding cassette, subfamily B, bacterial
MTTASTDAAPDAATQPVSVKIKTGLRSWAKALGVLRVLCPGRSTAAAAAAAVAALLPAAQVLLTAAAVQHAAGAAGSPAGRSEHLKAALFLGSLLGLASILAHAVGTLEQYLRSLVQMTLTTGVGEQIMDKATRMDLAQFEDSESYDVLQRALREGASRANEVFGGMLDALRDLVAIVSLAGVLLSWNPLVAAAVLAAPLPTILANVWYGGKVYDLEFRRAANRRRVFYYQFLTTTDTSFKEVRLFGLEAFLKAEYRRLVRTFLQQDRRLARRQMLALGSWGFCSVLLTSAAVVYVLYDGLERGDAGRIAGTLQSLSAVQSSATGLLMGLSYLFQSSLFMGNLFDFLELPEGAIRSGGSPFPDTLRRGIEFRNVTFRYPGTDRTVLEDVSFSIPAGQCMALVGRNGAGKTTVVKLLTRLYEPTSGEILIGGVPVQDYDLDDLRRNIGVIFQDFVRYEMDIRHNIGLGRVDELSDRERVLRAADKGGASSLIEALPRRLDTMLGRHFGQGHQLSGGQWQRIALARAFMRGAPVVVLDEPTAAIDAAAEAQVFERLRHAARDATSLIIAHRFSTVRMADTIVVLDGGSVREVGGHAELVARGGIYAELFELQAAAYRDGPGAAMPSGQSG